LKSSQKRRLEHHVFKIRFVSEHDLFVPIKRNEIAGFNSFGLRGTALNTFLNNIFAASYGNHVAKTFSQLIKK